MCILMVPLAISKLVCMHGITVLERIVSCDNINIGHTILLSVLWSCAKALHCSPLRYSYLSPQEVEVRLHVVREVELMLVPQCGA